MPAPITSSETRVNTFTAGDQLSPTILALPDGGWIIYWMSRDQDGSGWGVYGQRYDVGGVSIGAEFRVNTVTADQQYFPAAALLADGGWVVTWMSEGQDGSSTGIYGQRYTVAGTPAGAEFRVNSATLGNQGNPAVAALPDGGWVVAWHTRTTVEHGPLDIAARRYDAAGAPVGSEFTVNSTTASFQQLASVTALSDGGWLVTWMSQDQDGSGWGVYSQRYSAAGAAIGGEVRVNTTTSGDQMEPSVAMFPDGGWIVAWMSSGQDGSGASIYAQRFDAAGAAVRGEIQVNTLAAGDQGYPTVVALAGGGWAVRWYSAEPGFDPTGGRNQGLYLQRFTPADVPAGAEVRVGSSSLNDSASTGIALLPGGALVVAWGSYGPDGSGYGIFARTFDLVPANIINGTEGDDFIVGTSAADIINGLGGNDLILGASGNDLLQGGDGDDVLEGMSGIDTFDGGAGFDRISLHEEEATQAVTADLRTQTISNDGYGNAETMTSIEALGGGTRFADFFYGDDSRNLLVGSNGDTLYGFGGDDGFVVDGAPLLLDGGDGSDRIDLFRQVRLVDLNGDGIGEMEATANGVRVDLSINRILDDGFGGSGVIVNVEHVGGSAGDDILLGDEAGNQLSGLAGNDVLGGAGGDDDLLGGEGNDMMDGGAGTDHLFGGAGSDTANYVGAAGPVQVNLGSGTATGGAGNDFFLEVENVIGSAFDDELFGDAGSNRLDALGGADVLFGFGGDDTLVGGEGDDALRGDGGASYNGPGGNDTLSGGAGDDYLNGDAGTDSYDGGEGFDRVSFYALAATQGAVANLMTQTISNDGFGNAETMVSVEALGAGTAFADHFTGDDNANLLLGDDGDTLIANGGDDTFLLGSAPAFLDGGSGVDTIGMFNRQRLIPDTNGDGLAELESTTSGVDIDLRFNAFNDDGFGNSGIIVNVENVGGSELDDAILGSDNANILTGHGGADALYGFGGNDTVIGGDGDDELRGDGGAGYTGPGGDDTLIGGAGHDYLNGGQGTDSYDGGDGFDRVSFVANAASQGVVANLMTGIVSNDGFGNVETLANVEALGVGTIFSDTFIGDDNANHLWSGSDVPGAAGDTLIGNGGDDLLQVFPGDHTLDGGAGIDTVSLFDIGTGVTSAGASISLLLQGAAQDTRQGMMLLSGFENISGTQFDDALTGDGNDNVLAGHEGADVLTGGAGNDTLLGDGRIHVDDSAGAATGGPITIFNEVTNIVGPGHGDDLLEGGDGNDTLIGGGGSDTASYASATGDVFVSLAGGFASGAAGDDILLNMENVTGSGFDDQILGDGGDNVLDGGGGHDFIRGGDGADALIGGAGDDFLQGQSGDDLLDGGAGFDRAAYSTGALAGVTVDLRIDGVAQDTGSQGLDTLIGIEHVSGTIFNDVLHGDEGDNWIWGGSNTSGVTGNDDLRGGGGNDLIEVGTGTHFLRGGGGADTLSLYGNETDITAAGVTVSLQLQGAAQDTGQGMMNLGGFENLSGSIFADALTGDSGANLLAGDEGDDVLRGRAGNDILYGDGRVMVDSHGTGTSGRIVTVADVGSIGEPAGNDELHGGDGRDILVGGGGNDRLSGGDGRDTFLFGVNSGDDRITDFTNADTIRFEGIAGVDDLSDLTFTRIGANTLISWGDGSNTILVNDSRPAHFDASDFSFG